MEGRIAVVIGEVEAGHSKEAHRPRTELLESENIGTKNAPTILQDRGSQIVDKWEVDK